MSWVGLGQRRWVNSTNSCLLMMYTNEKFHISALKSDIDAGIQVGLTYTIVHILVCYVMWMVSSRFAETRFAEIRV